MILFFANLISITTIMQMLSILYLSICMYCGTIAYNRSKDVSAIPLFFAITLVFTPIVMLLCIKRKRHEQAL